MKLLELLSDQKFVSGETIARTLKISRAAVHKQIRKMREQGYAIKGEKSLGYTLMGRPDLLTPEELSPRIRSTAALGRRYIYFAETSSTQIVAKQRAENGDPEGTVVVAERQTGGYGRMQRKWSAPEGGIWFSLILRPHLSPEKIPQLTLSLSYSLCVTLERLFPVSPRIKWPNDILVNGRKLVGIITEMSSEIDRLNWVVQGVGVNANNILPGELAKDAITLAEATGGKHIGRADVLAAILNDFDSCYRVFLRDGFKAFAPEYHRRLSFAGKQVTVSTPDGMVTGRVLKVDDDGFLWLETGEGGTKKILAGSIVPGGRSRA